MLILSVNRLSIILMIKTLDTAKRISLIGFKCYEGVRRNNGRVATCEEPDYAEKVFS